MLLAGFAPTGQSVFHVVRAHALYGSLVMAQKWLSATEHHLGPMKVKVVCGAYWIVIDACSDTGDLTAAEYWLFRTPMKCRIRLRFHLRTYTKSLMRLQDVPRFERLTEFIEEAGGKLGVTEFSLAIQQWTEAGNLSQAEKWL